MHLGNGQWTPMCTVHLLGAVSVGVGIGLRLARKYPIARKVSYATRGAVISVVAAYALSIAVAELFEHVLLGAHVLWVQRLLDSDIGTWAERPPVFVATLLIAVGLWAWAIAEAFSPQYPGGKEALQHATANR